jgi:hypothetical protein
LGAPSVKWITLEAVHCPQCRERMPALRIPEGLPHPLEKAERELSERIGGRNFLIP